MRPAIAALALAVAPVPTGIVASMILGSLFGGAPSLGLRGSATLASAQIAASTCATQTISVPGAVAGAACVVGGPSTLEACLVQACIITATDTATLRTCDVTASPVTPAAGQIVAVRVFN